MDSNVIIIKGYIFELLGLIFVIKMSNPAVNLSKRIQFISNWCQRKDIKLLFHRIDPHVVCYQSKRIRVLSFFAAHKNTTLKIIT